MRKNYEKLMTAPIDVEFDEVICKGSDVNIAVDVHELKNMNDPVIGGDEVFNIEF